VTEVFLIVEGQTEETFVNEVLYEHLFPKGVWPRPLLTGTRKTRRAHKGGHRGSFRAVQGDIERTLREHGPRGCRVTTMLDLYGLPLDFPGFATKEAAPDPYDRVARIEEAMSEAVDNWLFIPYVQLHEFEALLLADPQGIVRFYPARVADVEVLAKEVGAFRGPEWVDDGKMTAPSRRIAAHVPEYDKVLAGSLIALSIGLPRIIERCPHFAQWVAKLEAFGDG
jgi:hypothetical protein